MPQVRLTARRYGVMHFVLACPYYFASIGVSRRLSSKKWRNCSSIATSENLACNTTGSIVGPRNHEVTLMVLHVRTLMRMCQRDGIQGCVLVGPPATSLGNSSFNGSLRWTYFFVLFSILTSHYCKSRVSNVHPGES